MAKIKPFKAVIYNQEKVGDLSRVVCPPYDVISPSRQDYFHKINTYNFIHVLFAKDIEGVNKYQRAAKIFIDWMKNDILVQDELPSVYFYSQQYYIRGEKKTRAGFIALLRLEEKNASVFGHEHTRLEPKEDRLKLLRRVKANLSPIFAIFSDKKRFIQRIQRDYIPAKRPFIDILDDEKTEHKLWRITEPQILERLQHDMLDENIFIADGHHRYEVACAYRDEMKQKSDKINAEEDFNYILTYFTPAKSLGQTILPTHRLLRSKVKIDMQDFTSRLKSYFDLEEIKDKTRYFFLMQKAGQAEHLLGVYHDKKYWFLRLKNIKILSKLLGNSPVSSLDVSILNTLVFKNILGLDLTDKDIIIFNQDAGELIREADNHSHYIVFFLNPVTMQQIMSVALSGEKMPPKSTYFYPKVLSGLVINRHGN